VQEEERHAAELEENRGVALHLHLAAAPTDPASAAARGIKRTADKLVLPASAGASLLAQDASKNGTMLFEVAAANGARTHAAVLEVRGGGIGGVGRSAAEG
jgi:ubiquitin fusion degradation protein 1